MHHRNRGGNGMKNGMLISGLTCLMLLSLFAAVSQAQDNSPSNAAAIGTPVKSIVELGSVMTSNYDVTVTVLEAIRGKGAMDRLTTANPGNKPPKAGFEYILARVRFEVKGRAVSDDRSFELGSSPLQWVALSSDLAEYPGVSASPPKPGLTGPAPPGQVVEGWLVFAVDQKDSKPIMVFDPDSGGATGRGKPLFFKLY
jgi:hypothetical protein